MFMQLEFVLAHSGNTPMTFKYIVTVDNDGNVKESKISRKTARGWSDPTPYNYSNFSPQARQMLRAEYQTAKANS